MGANAELRAQIAAYLRARDDVSEKAIVGGHGFLWRGNLVCGVLGEDLLVRVGKQHFEENVTRLGARPMVMAGRTSHAWIVVDANHLTDDATLGSWLDLAVEFAATLPAKGR
jgi:TfoX/Sxy family transcriptional regulator of competence genes